MKRGGADKSNILADGAEGEVVSIFSSLPILQCSNKSLMTTANQACKHLFNGLKSL